MSSNGVKVRGYPCDQCGKAFTSSHQLAQHNRIHTGEKPYKCTYCERGFKQLSHLQQHIRLHTGERPYKCTVAECGRSFIQLSNLQQHTKSHSLCSSTTSSEKASRASEKRFFCLYCRKGFKEHSTLVNHETSKHSLGAAKCAQHQQQSQAQMLANNNNNTSQSSSSLSPSSSSSTSTSGGCGSAARLPFCDRCGQVFINDFSLVNHLQQMANDPKHQMGLGSDKLMSLNDNKQLTLNASQFLIAATNVVDSFTHTINNTGTLPLEMIIKQEEEEEEVANFTRILSNNNTQIMPNEAITKQDEDTKDSDKSGQDSIQRAGSLEESACSSLYSSATN